MKYFDFYELPVSFVLDKAKLRRLFLLKSRAYHPDFHSLESAERQEEILILSTLNNEAYKVLNEEDKRLQYILEQKGLIGEQTQNKMPQGFLMEMMDINEQVMDLQFDFDSQKHQIIIDEVAKREADLENNAQSLLQNYDDDKPDRSLLHQIRDYYLEKRYLLRLKENVAKLGKSL